MFKTLPLLARVGLVTAVVLASAHAAHAQASRTWVSGVGDDANPCSRTAPCKTFAGAISKTADGGIIDALDPAGYGAVTITKAITIEGGLWNSSVLASGTNGIVVQAGPSDVVVIRNLAIEGIGSGINGIRFLAGAELHVEHVTITNFTGKGIDSEGGSRLYVENSSVRGNAGGGVYLQQGEGTINHVTAEGNFYGVRVGVSGIVTVSNSTASGGNMGFLAANDPAAVLNIDHSLSTHNDFGVVVSQGATVRCNGSTIINNRMVGLSNDGSSTLVSFGNNTLLANGTNGSFTSTISVQ